MELMGWHTSSHLGGHIYQGDILLLALLYYGLLKEIGSIMRNPALLKATFRLAGYFGLGSSSVSKQSSFIVHEINIIICRNKPQNLEAEQKYIPLVLYMVAVREGKWMCEHLLIQHLYIQIG